MDDEADERLCNWMRQAQDGDRRAYEALLREVATLVRAFVRKRLSQAAWVDDIVQETLVSIHRDRHTYDPRRRFAPWMYSIARHRMIDYVRKQRRLSLEQASTGAQFAGLELGASLIERLHGALQRLTSNQRQAVEMLKLGGYSVKEVSEETGMSESSVKVNAHRGYKNLRKLLLSGSHEDR